MSSAVEHNISENRASIEEGCGARPLAELKTAAVNMTCCPRIAGFTSAVRVVLVEMPDHRHGEDDRVHHVDLVTHRIHCRSLRGNADGDGRGDALRTPGQRPKRQESDRAANPYRPRRGPQPQANAVYRGFRGPYLSVHRSSSKAPASRPPGSVVRMIDGRLHGQLQRKMAHYDATPGLERKRQDVSASR